uniref:Secreted fester n=1 Tax=Botryllus schlosseri TaxID=30301 RepID=Q0ZD82_BOTSH|nr:secreted fester [Botryllus schlosseri]
MKTKAAFLYLLMLLVNYGRILVEVSGTATVAVHSLDAEPRSIGSYITLVSDVYNDDIDNNVEIMLFSQLPNQTAVRVAYYYYRKWSDETPADEAQYTFNYLNISQGARKDFSRNYTWYFDYLPEDYDQLTAITQVIVDTVPYTQTNTLKVEECSKTIGVATSTICNNDTCGYNCECQFACPARYKYISSVSSSTKFRCTANAVWNTEETICAPELTTTATMLVTSTDKESSESSTTSQANSSTSTSPSITLPSTEQ